MSELREIVAEVIRARAGRKEAAVRISSWAADRIAPADRDQFVEIAEAELLSLHEGNFARYQIKPSEFAAWCGVWGRQ